MSPQAFEYVQNQLVRAPLRLRPYALKSEPSFWYPKRPGYFRAERILNEFLKGKATERWLLFPGLSGVGKTTILAQLYFRFAPQMASNRILALNLDDMLVVGVTLQDTLDAYERTLGESFEALKEPVILLVDEAHRDKKWSLVLKTLFNRTQKVFIFCTGSSALLLKAQAEDLGRRITVERLYPLNFFEFQMIKHNKFPEKGLMESIRQALYGSNNAKEAYDRLKALENDVAKSWAKFDRIEIDDYLRTGTFPFTVGMTDEARVYQSVDRILDKIIEYDVGELGTFSYENTRKIKPLLRRLAQSSITNASKTAAELDIDPKTFKEMIDAMVMAELIIKVDPAGGKLAKYLFMCPLIRFSLLDITGLKDTYQTRRGSAMEDVVGMHLYREFLANGAGRISHDAQDGGGDFVLEVRDARRLAIEVGFGNKPIGQVKKTMGSIRCTYGIVISSSPLSVAEHENIVSVPLDYFFLM